MECSTKFIKFSSSLGVKALQDGQVIAFPTETVYGLGCVYDNYQAFLKLVEIKKRPPNKPFTLMGGKDFDFNKFAYIDDKIQRVISQFVPGPLTLLLRPKENLPYQVSLDSPSIGIRISSNSKLQDFISRVGKPLLVPSANLSSMPPLLKPEEVYNQFKGQIEYIIDDAYIPSKPSTIVDFTNPNQIKLIRLGELSFDEILKVYKGE